MNAPVKTPQNAASEAGRNYQMQRYSYHALLEIKDVLSKLDSGTGLHLSDEACRYFGCYETNDGRLLVHMMRISDGSHYLVLCDEDAGAAQAFGISVNDALVAIAKAMGVESMTKISDGVRL